MFFHSFAFVVFFAVTFGVFWGLPSLVRPLEGKAWLPSPHRLRLVWLLLASCVFYMSWNPWLILLILFSASVDYLVALRMERVSSPGGRKALLILSISVNLGLLMFFKYTNFFLANAHALMNSLGVEGPRRVLDLVLPLGISFYTFETISYIVDVYSGRIKAVRNLLDYALYIMFFPHLLAGPIVRPRDFLPQIRQEKRFDWDRLQLGAQYFLVGLFKKAVLADQAATIADPVFAHPGEFASSAVWLGVLCYAVQIYCDFSGYTDMAIGVAHAFGFKLPLNFNMPYFAANVSEFWRRWHVSLSSWLRDYLYIPLGGSRGSRLATYRNLFLTMLLGGLWHGANWTFVAWGALHGAMLAAHRAVPLPRWTGHPFFRPVLVAVTFLCVCVGWVFFRAQSFADAATILARMAWAAEGKRLDEVSGLIAAAVLSVTLVSHLLGTFVNWRKVERWLPAPALGAGLAGLLLLAQFFMPEDGKSFIYFQF
jgi:alginate O-acetyltransferase complex protein AlgI